MNVRQTLIGTLRYAISLTLLILVWAIAVNSLHIANYLLPPPSTVFNTLISEWPSYAGAARSTFLNALVGGGIGIALGLLIGSATAYSRTVRWIVEPYLTVFQSFPREAFFPLIVVWLGFGAMPKMVNATLLAMLPMAVVTLNSLTDTREEYIRLFESWKASRWQTFIYCRLPAAVPGLMGGLRVALPLALIGAVLGEFLGGSEGLGYIIVTSGSAFRIDRTFAAIIVLATGGTLLVAMTEFLRITALQHFYQR